MLKWSNRARSALPTLFKPLQDIDIYVEDVNDEVFYECLFKYATNNEIRIARIFGLGGRDAVINKAATHDHKARRAVFVIDGDLEWVCGIPSPEIVGLHRHDAYCVENLLICEKALSTIVSQEIIITEDDARDRLNFAAWRTSVTHPLAELFASFGVLFKYKSSISTVSRGVGILCASSKQGTILDADKVRRTRDCMLSTVVADGNDPQDVGLLYEKILERIYAMPDPLQAISGKNYLLPLVNFKLSSIGCRVNSKSLRVRLASTGDVTRFARLAYALRCAVQSLQQVSLDDGS